MAGRWMHNLAEKLPSDEPWDETVATALLQEYTSIIAGLPEGSITWAGDVGLYPDDAEKAIDEAANRHNMAGLRQAVDLFKVAAQRIVNEKARVQEVMRRALEGTLQRSHRLPVRESQRGILGKVLLIVETQTQAEVLAVHSPPDTTTFYREEFADFLRALQAGEEIAGWMMAKRKFKGVTVEDEQNGRQSDG